MEAQEKQALLATPPGTPTRKGQAGSSLNGKKTPPSSPRRIFSLSRKKKPVEVDPIWEDISITLLWAIFLLLFVFSNGIVTALVSVFAASPLLALIADMVIAHTKGENHKAPSVSNFLWVFAKTSFIIALGGVSVYQIITAAFSHGIEAILALHPNLSQLFLVSTYVTGIAVCTATIVLAIFNIIEAIYDYREYPKHAQLRQNAVGRIILSVPLLATVGVVFLIASHPGATIAVMSVAACVSLAQLFLKWRARDYKEAVRDQAKNVDKAFDSFTQPLLTEGAEKKAGPTFAHGVAMPVAHINNEAHPGKRIKLVDSSTSTALPVERKINRAPKGRRIVTAKKRRPVSAYAPKAPSDHEEHARPSRKRPATVLFTEGTAGSASKGSRSGAEGAGDYTSVWEIALNKPGS